MESRHAAAGVIGGECEHGLLLSQVSIMYYVLLTCFCIYYHVGVISCRWSRSESETRNANGVYTKVANLYVGKSQNVRAPSG